MDATAGGLRLRLAGDRLRLRRQRLGAAPGREGLLGRRARVRPALCRPRVPELHRRSEALLLEPAARHEGHLPADHLQGRLGRLRLRRGRRQPRLRQHALRAAEGSSSRTASGRSMEDWESALAPHYAEAQRMLGVVQNPHDDPADQLLRELGEELGVGDTYKKTPVGIYFGEPRQDRPRPVLRRRGPRPDRLPRCAGAAWSAARTAPRTRSSRTTSTSPRSAARR